MRHAIVGNDMIKSRVIGFDEEKLKKKMMQKVIGEQNSRLIAYAKEQIVVIGDKITSYHSRNHMDRTGNLLDSLLWGVSYRGKLVQGGFYREARASKTSYLHEWFSGDEKYLEPVNGRELAAKYLETYGNNGQGDGWKDILYNEMNSNWD